MIGTYSTLVSLIEILDLRLIVYVPMPFTGYLVSSPIVRSSTQSSQIDSNFSLKLLMCRDASVSITHVFDLFDNSLDRVEYKSLFSKFSFELLTWGKVACFCILSGHLDVGFPYLSHQKNCILENFGVCSELINAFMRDSCDGFLGHAF